MIKCYNIWEIIKEASNVKKYLAEFLGTMIFVIIGCGSVSIATKGAGVTDDLAVAFAFGLAIMLVIYLIGNISGAHINPAVSLAMYLNNKLSAMDMLWYWVAQIIGALVGAFVLYLISNTFDATYGANIVNQQFTLFQGALFETVFTFIFVLVILVVTTKKELQNMAGIIIGLTLTVINIVGIPITGASVNPARSIGPALISLNQIAIQELWIFIVFPLIGAAIAALVWKAFKS